MIVLLDDRELLPLLLLLLLTRAALVDQPLTEIDIPILCCTNDRGR